MNTAEITRRPRTGAEYAEAWAWLAKNEGYKPRLPSFPVWAPPEGKPTARSRIIDVMSREGMLSREIAAAAQMRHRTASMTLSDLLKVGKVEAVKRGGANLWRLPS